MELRTETEVGRLGKPGERQAAAVGVAFARGLREQIGEQLRLEIIRGNYPTGEPLIERKLAERFGVSHAPVREALLQLAHEGLTSAQANLGVRVAAPPSVELMAALVPSRQEIHRLALAAAAPKMTQEHHLWLESCATRMASAIARRDAGEFQEANYLFHRAIHEWSEVDHLHSLCRVIGAYVGRYYACRPFDVVRAQKWVDQHLAVVAHLRQQDLSVATEALLENVRCEMLDE